MDRILITDDEPDLLDLAKRNLESAGYTVLVASNGKEAIEKADTELPDLILLDVVMPGMSGFEACKALKEQPKTKSIPVVMFTALGRDVDRMMGLDAGADGFITKPIAKNNLITEVEKILEGVRPERFSKIVGLSHAQMSGRRILFEFDPSTSYERCVRDFALEALAQGEAVTVLRARTSSVVYLALEKERDVEFLPLRHIDFIAPILSEHEGSPLTLIFDSLTDMILSEEFKHTYTFITTTINKLMASNVTALFLLNQDAHSHEEIATIRGLFQDQLAFGDEGLKKIRLT